MVKGKRNLYLSAESHLTEWFLCNPAEKQTEWTKGSENLTFLVEVSLADGL